jgi:hypothetical protein
MHANRAASLAEQSNARSWPRRGRGPRDQFQARPRHHIEQISVLARSIGPAGSTPMTASLT